MALLEADFRSERSSGSPTGVSLAIVPAHNEEDGIVATVRSLLDQTIPPERVVVMADNCTDRTVELARAAGATVMETVDNTAKKAGAINQGLAVYAANLRDDELVICMDADGVLRSDFVEVALEVLATDPTIGGLSGSIVARPPTNTIEAAQAIEYARGSRLTGRKRGRVHVLSGAVTVFPVRVLRDVAASRGTILPGEQGQVFMEHSLTEDYELTIAVKTLGYTCLSTKRAPVVTDVMPTREMLKTQRLRWFRGAMESLWLYGWTSVTWRTWLGVGFTFFASLLFPLAVALVAVTWTVWDAKPVWYFLILFPLFLVESLVAANRVNRRARIVAWAFIPLWLYDQYMFFLYWRALFAAVRNKTKVWIT